MSDSTGTVTKDGEKKEAEKKNADKKEVTPEKAASILCVCFMFYYS